MTSEKSAGNVTDWLKARKDADLAGLVGVKCGHSEEWSRDQIDHVAPLGNRYGHHDAIYRKNS